MKCMMLLIFMLVSCTTLYKDKRIPSYHSQTPPHPRFESLLKLHPGKSGIIPLRNGEDALMTRIMSIREAKSSIDIQYYIWKDDDSGLLLLKELIAASDRGVRIRLLLDNFYESRYQKGFKILDQNPGIEVRLIDTNIQTLNRRMHNKSFTVDNHVSIVGGRNIGDEYFEISKESNFKDYDVVMIGPVVSEVSDEFDQFWNCKRSVPVGEIEKNPIDKRDLKKAEKRLASVKEFLIPETDALKDTKIFWADAHIFYDPPEKLEGKEKENLSMKLRPGLINLKKELILISPYFIPGRKGMKTLKELRKRNVRIVVLTNSLLSTDVLSTYGGYKKYREDMLKIGIEIFELKSVGVAKKKKAMGSSGSIGLHGKVVIGDREKMFAGSMNLDPRSKVLNTEMGVAINSPELANFTAEELLKSLPEVAYRVELRNNNLKWIEHTKDGEKVHSSEPGETAWKKFKTEFSSWVIPEQML